MDLKTLHGKRVSVAVPLQTEVVVVSGIAQFLVVPDVGRALQIEVNDRAGGFRLLIKESEWTGIIQHAAGGEVLISLRKPPRYSELNWPPPQKYIARGGLAYGHPEV